MGNKKVSALRRGLGLLHMLGASIFVNEFSVSLLTTSGRAIFLDSKAL